MMRSIEPRATFLRTWTFVVRWAVLFIALCAVWFLSVFVAAASDHLVAQMTRSKSFSITDQFPPPGSSGGILAVGLVVMFQFGLVNRGAADNIDTTDLVSERVGAWIIGASLIVLSFLLAFTVDMESDIFPLAAWALRSVSSIAITAAVAVCFYVVMSMTAQRRRHSGGALGNSG
jgi:hypothetical protein